MTPCDHMRRIMTAIAGHRFPLEDEKQTQAEIALALGRAGVLAMREVPIAGGVIDFVAEFGEVSLVTGRNIRIGIEVKIKGGAAAIGRQLKGYAAEDGLDGLLLVTSRAMALPVEIGGKPVAVVDLGRAWL